MTNNCIFFPISPPPMGSNGLLEFAAEWPSRVPRSHAAAMRLALLQWQAHRQGAHAVLVKHSLKMSPEPFKWSPMKSKVIWVLAINGRAARRWTQNGQFLWKWLLTNKFKNFIYFSASDRFNKIPISLFQTSKRRNSMISGFSNPWNPVFIHLIILKILQNIQEDHGGILENIIFHIWELWKSKIVTFFEKTGTGKWWRSVQ